jgi:hypothetical protein
MDRLATVGFVVEHDRKPLPSPEDTSRIAS